MTGATPFIVAVVFVFAAVACGSSDAKRQLGRAIADLLKFADWQTVARIDAEIFYFAETERGTVKLTGAAARETGTRTSCRASRVRRRRR
jgi:hypothetical protein